MVIVKEGGADPASNSRLADAIAKAKAANVPNDNIERTIKKASSSDAASLEEMRYDHYGPAGVAIIVMAATDNTNRTTPEIRSYFSKYKGNLGTTGCVGYLFEDKGVIMLSSLDCKSVKGTRTMVCNLLILILTAFAIIILAVSVFLSNFKVKNAIESEIVNMSVLKALGYTSGQIVAGITLPYSMVSLLFAVIGVGLSCLVLPVLSTVLTVQSGFSFSISFDLLSFVCVTCVLTSVVAFFTFLSARKIKKTHCQILRNAR